MPSPLICIPARLSSSRLPNKMLAPIAGKPLIQHVWEKACAANFAPVLVATPDQEIYELITKLGGEVMMTDAILPTGSDRVFQAVDRYDPAGRFDVVINLQGDMPTIDPKIIALSVEPLQEEEIDIGTLVSPIIDKAELTDQGVAKAVLDMSEDGAIGRALYFSRVAVPANAPIYWHHIGIYAYRRAALARYVSLPRSLPEQWENLEQLRALRHGMAIAARKVHTIPFGVDYPTDLERARKILENATGDALNT